METAPVVSVYCNGVKPSDFVSSSLNDSCLQLDYRSLPNTEQNVRIALPKFVGSVNYLPSRILDLLEIAGYVYCADRLVSRGSRSALEYHRWSRRFNYHIKVRDYEFWSNPNVVRQLSLLLEFLSGDYKHHLKFYPGHETPKTSLFDSEDFDIDDKVDTEIILFSGGLDSLSGTFEQLTKTDKRLCLVSHQSNQPSTKRTQEQLFKKMNDVLYPSRLRHYRYDCSLKDQRAKDENQRLRFFLYSAIAYAVAHVYHKRSFFVYENGITSFNLPKREDLKYARASRTTHPQTIHLLQQFLSMIDEHPFSVTTPFIWMSKTDILTTLKSNYGEDLISSSVSCSKTFKADIGHTHCGGCSQCVDRVFAIYASELEEYDIPGLYTLDIIRDTIPSDENKETLVDFLNQAQHYVNIGLDGFYNKWSNELIDIIEYIDEGNEQTVVPKIYELHKRHGTQVIEALKRIQQIHDDLRKQLPEASLLDIINRREYLKELPTSDESNTKILPFEVFFSYSHRDEKFRKEIETHLSQLKREGSITEWHDRKINPGREWEGQIDEHLNRARIILLFISPDFLASDYCMDVEMRRALERHEKKEARVIPIILRNSDWHDTPFGKLQALPTDGNPVRDRRWHSKDDAYSDIVKGIRRTIKELMESS